jgi:hypothetical protein
MRLQLTNDVFKKIIILFWTFWWLIAFWTDMVGAHAHMGLLNASWAPDTNYPFLAESLKMYQVSEWFVNFLFVCIILWSLAATLAFCWASLGLTKSRAVWMQRMQFAFIVSLTYWLAFFLADQVVMKFDLEENHMVQGGFQLLTFLAIYWLPEDQL